MVFLQGRGIVSPGKVIFTINSSQTIAICTRNCLPNMCLLRGALCSPLVIQGELRISGHFSNRENFDVPFQSLLLSESSLQLPLGLSFHFLQFILPYLPPHNCCHEEKEACLIIPFVQK
jgi:hypothetical protein